MSPYYRKVSIIVFLRSWTKFAHLRERLGPTDSDLDDREMRVEERMVIKILE